MNGTWDTQTPLKGPPPQFYNRTSADDEDLSDFRALKEKRLCFSIFYNIDMTTWEGIHRTVKLSFKVVAYPLQLI